MGLASSPVLDEPKRLGVPANQHPHSFTTSSRAAGTTSPLDPRLPCHALTDPTPAFDAALPTPPPTSSSSPPPSRQLQDDLPLTDAHPVEAQPRIAHVPPLMTPPAEDDEDGNHSQEPDWDLLLSIASAPTQARPAPSSRLNLFGRDSTLRLPSFEGLGIAAPHPDRFGFAGLDGAGLVQGAELVMSDAPQEPPPVSVEPLTAFDSVGDGLVDPRDTTQQANPPGRVLHPPIRHHVNTFTPPADGISFKWDTVAPTQAMASPAINDAGAALDSNVKLASTESGEVAPGGGSTSWIDDVVAVLVENLPRPSRSLSVLSHALPSPSTSGHIFSTLVAALHQSTPASETVWINVFHAVPGKFNLADLPTSPPPTPAPMGSGEDYFTAKTFDSAVSIPDYQDDLSGLAHSPRPVVRPSSIDVSIVERYIPPTSKFEIANLFNPSGSSILVDRLVELSPENGSLLFVYPTHKGGRTFMQEYLSPILDPTLRSMVVVHRLSADFSRLVGTMAAVEDLLDHESMDRGIRLLCTRLSRRDSSLHRFHAGGSRFELCHSARARVRPSRETWSRDWWAKQEKPRVRELITRFVQDVQRKGHPEHVGGGAATPTVLLQHLLDEVVKKDYEPGLEPRSSIEVSVFVIKRCE